MTTITHILTHLAALGLTLGLTGPAAALPSLVPDMAPTSGLLEVDANDGASWRSLDNPTVISAEATLRTGPSGGAATLTDEDGAPLGRVFLDARTRVSVQRSPQGSLFVRLEQGRARLDLSGAGGEVRAAVDGGFSPIAGEDVILERRGKRVELLSVRRFPELAEWSHGLDVEGHAGGLGRLEARAAGASVAQLLTLRRVHVRAERAGDVVRTRVEHIFYNDSDEQLEGTFRFPLPANASVTDLAMEIDGELMQGEIVEREKARKIYQDIVDSMRDPAILEWEQGQLFKLRVFPIEPRSEKRVVLTFVAPLERSPSGEGLAYRFDTAAPAMQERIDRLRLEFDGRTVVDAADFQPGRDIVVPVAEPRTAFAEVREDGTYLAARVAPDWAAIGASEPREQRAREVVIAVDTSRSALESKALALDALGAVFAELDYGDRFTLLATDIDARVILPPTEASPESFERAIRALEAIEPDGASDLGAAFDAVGAAIAGFESDGAEGHVQAVYIGDGLATWGETDLDALIDRARTALGGVSLHTLALGRSKDLALIEDLAAVSGGRSVAARTPAEARRFALFLAVAPYLPRLTELRVTPCDGCTVFPERPTTLFAGDALDVLVHSTQAPTSLTMTGYLNGTPVEQTIDLSQPVTAPWVAHRWAGRRIAQLQREGAEREAIVEMSQGYGVLSRYTAFLVLESEEAYERFGIERRKKREAELLAANTHVSGADLESLGERASLSPDHIQPGDPEVRVPAPADARSVVVVFPFGETKIARYEPELRAWTVRFLIDDETPDGTYWVFVRITHADGTPEMLKLPYTVDTVAPTVDVRMQAEADGSFTLEASQRATQVELESALPAYRRRGDPAEVETRYAHILHDAKRVEVRTPDGQVLTLTPTRTGHFAGRWVPTAPLAGERTVLRVVTADGALNVRSFEVRVPLAGGGAR